MKRHERHAIGIIAITVALYVVAVALDALWPKYDEELIRVAGSLLSVLGAVGLWLLKVQNDRRSDAGRYRNRQRRLLMALRAEIDMQLDTYFGQFGPSTVSTMRSKLIARVENSKTGVNSLPIGVVPKENDVFDRVKDEIADLPPDTIGPIIRYYQSDEYVVELNKAFTAGRFNDTEKDQRLSLVKSYVSLGLASTQLACKAILALSKELDDLESEVAVSTHEKLDALEAFEQNIHDIGWKP